MLNFRTSNQGYIALIMVMIVGSISLATSLALIMAGTNSQQSIKISQSYSISKNQAEACLEEALMVIQANPHYSGTGTLNFGSNACSYTVVKTSRTNRTITGVSNLNNVSSKVKVYAIISLTSISVTSWQEVAD